MNNKVDAVITFLGNCIGEKVIIALTSGKTIVGKVSSVNGYEIKLSKEENFYVVGKEENKYSSMLIVDPRSITDAQLVLKELEKKE